MHLLFKQHFTVVDNYFIYYEVVSSSGSQPLGRAPSRGSQDIINGVETTEKFCFANFYSFLGLFSNLGSIFWWKFSFLEPRTFLY